MTVTVLADNAGCGNLKGEWGLSFHIEYEGRRFLLDVGASGLFISNAEKLGISIADVDCAVLSHAHYDHTLGLEAFLEANGKAPVYLSPQAEENCYSRHGLMLRYIGMAKGSIASHPDRIIRPVGFCEISEGVYIVPHSTEGLSRLGRSSHQYVRRGLRFIPDDYSHEQTLVFRTASGLVLMSSCSHSGAETIVNEVKKEFPKEKVAAYIGGLHLFRLKDSEIEVVTGRLADSGIGRIYTGHCTGQKGFDILRNRFGDSIEQFHCGMQISLS